MSRYSHLILIGAIYPAIALAQIPTNTTIAASPNPSNYGAPVTLTAIVGAGATGKVTFYDGVTILGVGTISGGQANLTTIMLPSGNRSLRAYYQGDGAYAGSSSEILPQRQRFQRRLQVRSGGGDWRRQSDRPVGERRRHFCEGGNLSPAEPSQWFCRR
jgi:hypothetical protein